MYNARVRIFPILNLDLHVLFCQHDLIVVFNEWTGHAQHF